MEKNDKRYQAYKNILKEELLPAQGCTEPIAIAYAGAVARGTLGSVPDKVIIEASENIIKNVKSVVVPNTGRLKGIEAAAAAGIVAGKAEKILEVIADVNELEQREIARYLKDTDMVVQVSESGLIFDIVVNVYHGDESASVQISHYHTNIVKVIKNGKVLTHNVQCNVEISSQSVTDRSIMNVEDIIDFAESVDLEDVKEVLQRQISCNSAIAEEGISGDWGANVGSTILNAWGAEDVKVRARAMAAAGSDARMSGCELPVIIASGSGNQGMTASLPVIEYAKELKSDQDTLYRALLVSNLVTIHQKTSIGRLSAFCGAVSAGVGAGAGIAWIQGGGYAEVSNTIVNALAIVSGIICDGAKPSCAGKIAAAVDAGIIGYQMYKNGQQFHGGEGIIHEDVEDTIKNVGRLGREGMKETDKEIIKIMLGK